MSVSRIEKMIFEGRGDLQSIEQCAKVRKIPLQIVLSKTLSSKVAFMAKAAVELGLRTFGGTISIFLEDGVISNADELQELLLAFEHSGRALNMEGRVRLNGGRPNHEMPILGICVAQGIYADASGWISKVNSLCSSSDNAEAPAAAMAVGCAFAKVFQYFLLGKPTNLDPWKFNLLRLAEEAMEEAEPKPGKLDLGTVTLFGAGATGNAFSFVIRNSDYSMNLTVIDRGFYEEPNQETSLMVGAREVAQGKDKAPFLASALCIDRQINAKAVVEEIASGSPILEEPTDFLIVCTDNSCSRRALDQANAKIIINAGLGGTASSAGHVLVTRHGEGDKELSALYPDRPDLEATGAKVPIEFTSGECSRIQYQSASLAAPFVALVAGALLVAGCAREKLGIDVATNYLKFDLFGALSAFDARTLRA